VSVQATSSSELNNIRNQSDEITVHPGAICGKHSVDRVSSPIEGYNDLLAFHLAAQAHISESWERPYKIIDTNVTSTPDIFQSVTSLNLDITKFNVSELKVA
jgi:dTDP-glucose 4,6-dehydratase